MLGECEQFFLELMKVPRMESKLRVVLFKIQFNAQVILWQAFCVLICPIL
ncbi:putative formin, FH2 domain-containing protein [Helianthus annuus]|nr:putative formin, FH2 domain-containing protein [Helianthus annuus]KAJ0834253.1 putative formin, FH2 domain-containing protein [Helianthus annuus]